MPLIVSRDEAAANGWKFFFTGRPCNQGHNAQRYVSSGTCKDCAALTSAAQRKARDRFQWPPGTVEFRQKLHPDDAATLVAWIDAQHARRGYPKAMRPESDQSGLTDFERFLALEMRKPPSLRGSITDVVEWAAARGIPETYSDGKSRPSAL